MGPDYADQLAPLNAIFAEVYHATRPAQLALLGCATGNGLEHVDPAITSRAIAIDVNPEYAASAKARHQSLGATLEVRCADVCSCVLPAAAFDLVHAALIFEHVNMPVLASRIATWLAPAGTCAVVLQVDSPAAAPVTPSPYRSLAALGASMHLASLGQVAELLGQHGLHPHRQWSVPLTGTSAEGGVGFADVGESVAFFWRADESSVETIRPLASEWTWSCLGR
ncbi:MAG: class I SAM-dependent methyltransferase, partial [Pseudomonadota bacterium]